MVGDLLAFLLAESTASFLFSLLFVIWLISKVVGWFGSDSDDAAAADFQSQLEKGLVVLVQPETFETEGESYDVMLVQASGVVSVPTDSYKAMLRVWLADVTDGDDDGGYAVYCLLPDAADENGCFSLEEEIEIPYEFSTLEDILVATIPAFALRCPFKGARRLRVSVVITDPHDANRLWTGGVATFAHHETQVGYLELEAHSQEMDRLISQLAVSVALADGQFDKSESRVIRRFFLHRYSGQSDEPERKKDISKTMKSTLTNLTERPDSIANRIKQVTSQISENGDPGTRREAYELCVQVVGADGDVTSRELKSIGYIARNLDLSDEILTEIHDRHLRVSAISDATFDPLQMPDGLSRDETLQWLAKEYKRWQPRQNHADQEIRDEAKKRIELIATRRRKVRDAAG